MLVVLVPPRMDPAGLERMLLAERRLLLVMVAVVAGVDTRTRRLQQRIELLATEKGPNNRLPGRNRDS